MGEGKALDSAALALLDPDGSFILRLRDDRAALTRLAAGLWSFAAGARRARLQEIEVLAHRLAGAAGTFGYERVGAAALALEDCLAERPDADRSYIEDRVAALRSELDDSLQNA